MVCILSYMDKDKQKVDIIEKIQISNMPMIYRLSEYTNLFSR